MRNLKTIPTTFANEALLSSEQGGKAGAAVWRRWLARGGVLVVQMALISAFAISAGANVFGVNQTNDATDAFPGDGECWTGNFVVIGGFGVKECSLRAALQESNAFSGSDSVVFSSLLAVDAFGTIVIDVSSALPQITDVVHLDGTTAPTYDVSSPNPVPVVELSGLGMNSTPQFDGLSFGESADGSSVRGLSIGNFSSDGIFLGGADGVLIDANHVGLRRGGDPYGNGRSGIRILEAAIGTRIGTTFNEEEGFLGTGNVISGNRGFGIYMQGANTRISGNRIGTDRFGNRVLDGTTNLGNQNVGIAIVGDLAANTQIGQVEQLKDGTWVASGNAISGNWGFGVAIGNGASPNISIRGNSIGVGLDGTTALGNREGSGIYITGGADGVQIGEVGVGRNIIGAHQEHGIEIAHGVLVPAIRTKVIGNRIGRSADGNSLLPNGENGIFVSGGVENEIAYNEISGGQTGIRLEGYGNRVYANYVGTNAAGLDLGNAASFGNGIVDAGDANEIGSDGGLGNVIGFSHFGIVTDAISSSSLIQGNYIGTDAIGQAVGNQWGIVMRGSNAQVGGSALGEGNTIGFNQQDGLSLGSATSGNEVFGNFVGTNLAGDDLGNGGNGIEIAEAFFNTIGSNSSTPDALLEARKNVIAFNGAAGVALSEAFELQMLESASNAVRGNVFHDNDALAIDLGAVGPTGNDADDLDVGHNNLQNAPEIDPAQTTLDLQTGLLTIRYSVDSAQANSAYRLLVDFYLVSADGEEPGQWLGADAYLGTDAQLDKQITITPAFPIPSGSQIVATVIDDDDNSSEVSNRVPVPEPASGFALFGGMLLIASLKRGRVRTDSV